MMKLSSQKRAGGTVVRLGLLGCGQRPRGLFQILGRHFPKAPIRIHGVYDPDPAQMQKAKDQMGLPEATCYQTEAAILNDPALDWVAISSPNCMHADQVVRAFEAGKNVFCEKPLATSLQDCLKMEKAWKKSGKQFSFGFCLRYSPVYRRIAELLEQGVVGEIVSLEFNETLDFNLGGYIMGNWRRYRKNAGSFLLEKCCHDIDLVQWFTQSVPVRVATFSGLDFFVPKNANRIRELGKNAEGKSAYQVIDDPRGQNPFSSSKSTTDNQVMIAEFASGCRSTFHTNCNAAIPERRFYLLGSHGAIRGDSCTGLIEWQKIGFNTVRHSEQIDITGGHGGSDDELMKAFVETVLKKKAPSAGMEEAKRAAVACFGIDQAMDSGKVVDLRPLWKKAKIRI